MDRLVTDSFWLVTDIGWPPSDTRRRNHRHALARHKHRREANIRWYFRPRVLCLTTTRRRASARLRVPQPPAWLRVRTSGHWRRKISKKNFSFTKCREGHEAHRIDQRNVLNAKMNMAGRGGNNHLCSQGSTALKIGQNWPNFVIVISSSGGLGGSGAGGAHTKTKTRRNVTQGDPPPPTISALEGCETRQPR